MKKIIIASTAMAAILTMAPVHTLSEKHHHKLQRARCRSILELIRAAAETPFSEPGKPEALKHYKPLCSHRITREYRLVCMVQNDTLTVVACRFHDKTR